MTLPEVMLWQRLRGKQIGVKVRRQHPIGPYVADFFIPDRKLVIEVDGQTHDLEIRSCHDAGRDEFLGQNGYEVLRISASDVLKDVDCVLEVLSARLAAPLHHPSDGPPPRAGEDL